MVECADLISGHSKHCNARCERALIALASSDGGADLINCQCSSDSEYCSQSKQRIEVCRATVFRALEKDSIVSCNTARWVCMADPLCSTALDYYHHFCAKLFYGHHCNHRCNNSLSILNRQVNAQKLRTCFCDGTEDFPCKLVKYNTQKYCYGIVTPVVHFIENQDVDNSEQNRLRRLEQMMMHKLDDENMVGGYKRHKHRYYNHANNSINIAHLTLLISIVLGLVIEFVRWEDNVSSSYIWLQPTSRQEVSVWARKCAQVPWNMSVHISQVVPLLMLMSPNVECILCANYITHSPANWSHSNVFVNIIWQTQTHSTTMQLTLVNTQ